TKAAAYYQLEIAPGESRTIRLRLCDLSPSVLTEPFSPDFSETFELRRLEADNFYRSITPEHATDDETRLLRQAMAGMLWSKQYFGFDVDLWLEEHRKSAPSTDTKFRNAEWFHMLNRNVISMPDKWEYPWYAAWDLAFQALALSTV